MQPCCQRILAIEDDPILGGHLKTSLETCGFQVTLACDGGTGLALACAAHYDLILLDVLLPRLGGLEVLTRLRGKQRTPVLMMSALGDEAHRIQGFDCGADDYLPKPFSLEELQVRMAAILRRVAYERSAPHTPNDGALVFDDARSDLSHEGRWTGLTATEYRLLKLLYGSADEVLSKPFLYQQVLHRGYSQHDRSLDMHISNIRRKLARTNIPGLRVEAVWGKGYLLTRQDD
ncbi:response regulator transcription factor [Pseudomonas lopnurensis]|uniref:response regulator transcription factor n=1 Tax=Pseudomonas lopnurensis TaxID=1477517 RepID=UPI0028B02066|nr:response regulator transcription factor [Pseudomonas lopnurensis]